MKGKIINFSPHRRRGLIVVHVKGEEGMEYQHLQFDFKHYDASIETHLYKDQSVDVVLKNVKRGVYRVERITYDIGKNLYKRSQPERSSPEQNRYSRDDREGNSNNRNNYQNRKYSSRPNDRNRPRRDGNRDNREGKRKSFQGSRNSRQSSSSVRKQKRDQKNSQPQNKSGPKKEEHFRRVNNQSNRTKDQSSNKNRLHHNKKRTNQHIEKSNTRGFNRGRYRERLRYLAFFLHYRRVKTQKLEKLNQFQRIKKLNYRRKLRISN